MPDQLANLFETAVTAMAVAGLDGHFRRVNAACCELLGRSEEELLATSFTAISHPDEIGKEPPMAARLITGDVGSHRTTRRLRRGDGSVVDVEITASLLRDDEGQPDAFFVQLAPANGERIRLLQTEHRRAEEELRVADERFRLLVEGATQFVTYRFEVSPEHKFTHVSPASEALFGVKPEDFYEDPELWATLIHPDDVEKACEDMDPSVPVLMRWRRPDGTYAYLEHRRLPLYDDKGEVIAVDGIAYDVTERKLAQDALEARERRFRSLVHNVNDLIVVVDREGALSYTSPSLERILGYRAEDLPEGSPNFVHPDDLPILRAAFERAEPPGGTTAVATCRTRHRDGTWRWLEYSVADLRSDPAVEGYVVVARDVTERKQAEEQLVRQALHDALTDLPNRALFLDRLGLALTRLERRPGLAAVFFLDLDYFKVVNDSLGHTAGDHVLVAVADRLQRSLRDGDTAARLGGDEFAILCEDLVDDGEAVQIAERLGAAIASQPIPVSGRELVLSASIGVAFATRPRQRPEALLRDADAAMYRAKERGRARFELFDAAMRARALARLETEAALRNAVEQGELTLYYQPEVSLHDGTLIGAEALLRWQERRGLAWPADFVPVAEETGLILPIGDWVIREACSHLARWRTLAPDRAPDTISVNISGRQLGRVDLTDTVAAALAESGIPASSLCLEITESVLMDDIDATVEALKALKGLGVLVAVDDFGTGYSSLAHLRRFPVDVLKVDHSFVGGLGRNPEDAAIVRAVLALARTLDLAVVAEGVERADQLQELRVLGCERAQGNLFSPPIPEAEFADLLVNG